RIEKCRCAATPMQLRDRTFRADQCGLHPNFFFQIVEIMPRFFFMACHYFIAGAVVTNVLAKRHMYIQRQRCNARLRVLPQLFVLRDREVGSEMRRGWIRRITRSGYIVFADESGVVSGDQWRCVMGHSVSTWITRIAATLTRTHGARIDVDQLPVRNWAVDAAA